MLQHVRPGLFKQGMNLRFADRGEISKKFRHGVTTIEIIQQRDNRHARACEAGHATLNIRIDCCNTHDTIIPFSAKSGAALNEW